MTRSRRPSKQMLTLLDALSVRPQEWRHGYDLMKHRLTTAGLALQRTAANGGQAHPEGDPA